MANDEKRLSGIDDAAKRLASDAEAMIVLANPVLPHSEGEIVLESADSSVHPTIRMNYLQVVSCPFRVRAISWFSPVPKTESTNEFTKHTNNFEMANA